MQLCKAKVEPLCFNFSWFSRGYSDVCSAVNKGILYSIQKLKCILTFQVAMLNRKVILTLWRALNTHYILDFGFLKLLILCNSQSKTGTILATDNYSYSGLHFDQRHLFLQWSGFWYLLPFFPIFWWLMHFWNENGRCFVHDGTLILV